MHEVPVVDVSADRQVGAAADPAGKYGVAQLHGRDARRGRGHASRARTGRRDRLPRRVAHAPAARSTPRPCGCTPPCRSSTRPCRSGGRRAAADVPGGRTRSAAQGAPDQPAADARQPRRAGLGRRSRGCSTGRSIATARDDGHPGDEHGDDGWRTFAGSTRRTTSLRTRHLLVVGDVTADSVLPKLERRSARGRTAAPIAKPALPAATQPTARQIYLIDKPGAAQSQIRIGPIGVARNTPDYYVIDVTNTMLGGSFSSRLNQNLREDHGYAYGAWSPFAMRATAGPFVAQRWRADRQDGRIAAGVLQGDSTACGRRPGRGTDACDATSRRSVSRVISRPPRTWPDNSRTWSSTACPRSLFNEYVPKIQAVTAADLAARRQSVPADGHVRRGRRRRSSKIEQPIRDAKFGPVTVVTVDDVLR